MNKDKNEVEKTSNGVKLPSRTYYTEFIVGVFSLIAMVCFAYLAINIGGFRVGGGGAYLINSKFKNVAGLKVGSPVEIAGVRIGEIEGVRLEGVEALVYMRINKGVKIREDDIAVVRTKGIIGDKYIKIIPGASDAFLAEGDELIENESAMDFEEIVGNIVKKVFEN